MTDPITLYKDGLSRRIPAIDAEAWIAQGWKETDETTSASEIPIGIGSAERYPLATDLQTTPDLSNQSQGFPSEIEEKSKRKVKNVTADTIPEV